MAESILWNENAITLINRKAHNGFCILYTGIYYDINFLLFLTKELL